MTEIPEDDSAGVPSEVCEPGVIYLSSIPNGMNAEKKGKFRQYEEGWVEFVRKKIAKKVAKRLNCCEVPGTKYHLPFCCRSTACDLTDGFTPKLVRNMLQEFVRLQMLMNSSGMRNPWYGELWNIRFLTDTSWNDLFASEREEQEQRRSAHDRDVIVAKRHARQFTAALEATKLEKKMELIKGKRFNKRKPMQLTKRQKPTENEILERMARSHRTPPEGSQLSALTNKGFMNTLFSGGL